MNRLLVTAFGSFPGVDSNPTTIVLEQVANGRMIPHGWTLSKAYLPVSYSYCDSWTRQVLRKEYYDVVLHLGVAVGSDGFRLEKYAHNECDKQAKDVEGICWSKEKINSRAPKCIPSPLRLEKIVDTLRARNLPVSLSEHAGTYLCNFIFFKSLLYARNHAPERKVGFLHVPMPCATSSDRPGFPLDMHVRVLQAVVREFLRDSSTGSERHR